MALAPRTGDDDSTALYTQLIMWRLLLASGIGGELPVAATNVAENVRCGGVDRARCLALLGACVALGRLLAAAVAMANSEVAPSAVGAALASASLVARWGCGSNQSARASAAREDCNLRP